MEDNWLKRWDERYRDEAYAFGTEPNKFLKSRLGRLPVGKILFPAEGEGRNAIYAAKLGWDVYAFDISSEGKAKALKLAKENDVAINYQVGELPDLNFQDKQFDVIALIFAHFPPQIKSVYHKILDGYLREDGIIIFEAFSKNHFDYRQQNEKVGGPRDLESLFSIKELQADFKDYEIMELTEKVVDLKEGLYHNGKGAVIRFVGRKRKKEDKDFKTFNFSILFS